MQTDSGSFDNSFERALFKHVDALAQLISRVYQTTTETLEGAL
jgi:hypothetical protein